MGRIPRKNVRPVREHNSASSYASVGSFGGDDRQRQLTARTAASPNQESSWRSRRPPTALDSRWLSHGTPQDVGCVDGSGAIVDDMHRQLSARTAASPNQESSWRSRRPPTAGDSHCLSRVTPDTFGRGGLFGAIGRGDGNSANSPVYGNRESNFWSPDVAERIMPAIPTKGIDVSSMEMFLETFKFPVVAGDSYLDFHASHTTGESV